ncbi:MAG: hypothetical protein AB7T06_10360 [Kofleriaceae bacterium]
MRFAAVALVAGIGCVAACLHPDLVPCGDKSCAHGQLCIEATCVDRDRVDACVDIADGDACEIDGEPGRCVNGACADAVCGDGVIDPGEDCEGDTGGSCLDYGFDMGNASCSETCRVDASNGCVRFGWRQVVNAPVDKMWASADRMVYTTQFPNALEIHGAGGDAVIPGSFQMLAGNKQRVYAAMDEKLFEIVGTTLVPIEAPPVTNPYIRVLSVTDDDTLYAHVDGTCGLWFFKPGGSWKEIPYTSPLDCVTDITASDGRVFTISDHRTVFELIGDQLMSRYAHGSDVRDILYDGDVLWLAAADGLYTWRTGATSTLRRAGAFTSLAHAGNRTYAASGTGLVERMTRSARDTLRAPSQGAIYSEGTTLYVHGGPIYAFTGIDFTEKESIPISMLVASPMVDVGRFVDGTVVAAADQTIFRDDDALWAPFANPGSPANIAALAVGGNRVVVSTSFEGDHQIMFESDRALTTWTPIDPPERPVVEGAFVAEDGTVYAVGRTLKADPTDPDRAAFAIRTGKTWSVHAGTEDGCRVDAVHRDTTGRVVAAGACSDHGVIWQHASSGEWTEIYRTPDAMPFVAVLATDDGTTFAAGDAGTVRGGGTSWIVDRSLHGRSLSGTTDDVWLAGYFTNVERFDGATWSQVTTQAITTMLVSVGDDDITFPGGASGRVRLVRDR